MSSIRFLVVTAVALGLGLPLHASATSLGLFHASARSLGQAGALTARADEPSALSLNPAAAARLPGLQLQGTLGLTHQRDTYLSASGFWRSSGSHVDVPDLFVTWQAPNRRGLTLGLGAATVVDHRLAWPQIDFPGRFLTRSQKVRILEVLPVLAWEIDERWSVGGGPRYLTGTLARGDSLEDETRRFAEADVDAWAFHVGVRFADVVWGWGAVVKSGARLEGTGRALRLQPGPPTATGGQGLRARQGFELPWELRAGVWLAPYPELRLELDASLQGWRTVRETRFALPPESGGAGQTTVPRDWRDTLSVRIGAEGDLGEAWAIFGGLGLEPSPVPSSTLEPGFPRGDAVVYGAGVSRRAPAWTVDVGYAYVRFRGRAASGQELKEPAVEARYGSRQHRLAVTARWRAF